MGRYPTGKPALLVVLAVYGALELFGVDGRQSIYENSPVETPLGFPC